MQGSATVSMAAPAEKIWDLIADIRNTGRFSPEVLEAEWLDGATGPTLGARFRGHVKRNEIGPVYWTTCRVTACEPGREFGFDVLVGHTTANAWHYRLTPVDGGTEVTESFRMPDSLFKKLFSVLGGQLRQRRNVRDMRTTLERIKAVAEAPEGA
jgi:Polyketide cyclase / dehydrase and lipid transport